MESGFRAMAIAKGEPLDYQWTGRFVSLGQSALLLLLHPVERSENLNDIEVRELFQII